MCAGALFGAPACGGAAGGGSLPVEEPGPAEAELEAEPVEAEPADAEPVEAVAEPEPAVAEPVAPAAVRVTVTTSPAGASVYRDDVILGRTPLVLELPRSDAAVDLRVEHEGYVTVTQSVTPGDDQEVTVTLVKQKKAKKKPRRPRGGGEGGVGRGFILS